MNNKNLTAIDTAFKAWRTAYNTAYAKVQDAQKQLAEAEAWHSGESSDMKAAKTALRRAELKQAQEDFANERERLQTELNANIATARQDMKAETAAANLMQPEMVDAAGLAILNSGAMNAADYMAFEARYADNATMLRIVSRYAAQAAEDETDPHAKGALHRVAIECRDGLNKDAREFESLAKAAFRLSGQSDYKEPASPELTLNLAQRWESVTTNNGGAQV